jgi:thioredoxin reductase (NADPH)
MREKKRERYDVVIIGGGPAGLTAAIYCGRARLNTLLIEKGLVGGLATYTNEIENFPGFPEGTSGLGLMEKFQAQAKKFGVRFKGTDVKEVNFDNEWKEVHTFRNIFESRAVIIASGGRPRTTGAGKRKGLPVRQGHQLLCHLRRRRQRRQNGDDNRFRDAAIEEGMFLTKFAKEVVVSVIHDEGKMDCNEIAKEQAMNNPKMSFAWNTMVNSFKGEGHLDTVELKNLKTGELTDYKVDTCFEFIGYVPNTEIFKGTVTLDKQGYIPTNEVMEIGIPVCSPPEM